jgi:hypothetical protein
MAEPAPDLSSVQSNGGATGTGGVTGKGFQPGKSGNPSGRPKGLARQARDVVGEEALVNFWAAAQAGWMVYRHPVTEVVTYEKVAQHERIAVSKLLAERGWGKPAEFVPIEDSDPLDLAEERAKEIAAEMDGKIDELEARRRLHEEAA